MSLSARPVLESRAGNRVYLIPLALGLGAVALIVALIVMMLVAGDSSTLDLAGPLFVIVAVVNLVLAGVWAWGTSRSRVVITPELLTVLPVLGRAQSVQLSTLARVDLNHVGNGAGRVLKLTDVAGGSAPVGLGGIWEREAEILQLIAEAARRSGATVDEEAQQVLGDAT